MRDQTIASCYLGVMVELSDVDWALEDEQQAKLTAALERARDGVIAELRDEPRFAVEFG